MNAPFSYSSPTLSVEALKHSIAYKLMFTIGKDPVIANKHEWLNATLFAVRDRMVERWLRSNRAQLSQETRQGAENGRYFQMKTGGIINTRSGSGVWTASGVAVDCAIEA